MRVWAIAASAILVSVGASSAHPLDSPGTVYIDGVPCNLACRSYMDWSRRTLNGTLGTPTGVSNSSAHRVAKEAPHKRVSRRVVPLSVAASPRKNTNGLHAAVRVTPGPPPPWPRTENAPLKAQTPVAPLERSPQEQVMAALAVAEQITKAETPIAASDNGADENKPASAGDANAEQSRDSGALVALLISRPDVKTISELKGLNIAIDAAQSITEEDYRSALTAAGATEIQLSVNDTNPLDRLINGEVQAAVLERVSPDAAEAFPEIKGFKVFRLQLLPR
jgi:hypothetical protein